jgi:HK97 family phage major capsid protein
MAVLETGDLSLPPQILDPWLGKVQHGSSVAALSNSIPMQFGAGQSMTFDIGEAEYVGEGANKGASTVTPTTKTVTPFKFHKTVRWTEEVMWADEDYQLGVVEQILGEIQPALSRALDYGVYHGINPADGAAVAAMTEHLSDTTNLVTRPAVDPGAPYTYLDSADELVLADDYVPSDVAIDPSFAAGFSTLRGTTSEQKLYPNFRLTTEVSELDGHRASVSKTVRATAAAAAATNLLAFVGDFSAIRWGIQRAIGLEVIRYGDPDGQGDLKRNNQVAFRAEVVYGWGIADLNAFAKIVQG